MAIVSRFDPNYGWHYVDQNTGQIVETPGMDGSIDSSSFQFNQSANNAVSGYNNNLANGANPQTGQMFNTPFGYMSGPGAFQNAPTSAQTSANPSAYAGTSFDPTRGALPTGNTGGLANSGPVNWQTLPNDPMRMQSPPQGAIPTGHPDVFLLPGGNTWLRPGAFPNGMTDQQKIQAFGGAGMSVNLNPGGAMSGLIGSQGQTGQNALMLSNFGTTTPQFNTPAFNAIPGQTVPTGGTPSSFNNQNFLNQISNLPGINSTVLGGLFSPGTGGGGTGTGTGSRTYASGQGPNNYLNQPLPDLNEQTSLWLTSVDNFIKQNFNIQGTVTDEMRRRFGFPTRTELQMNQQFYADNPNHTLDPSNYYGTGNMAAPYKPTGAPPEGFDWKWHDPDGPNGPIPPNWALQPERAPQNYQELQNMLNVLNDPRYQNKYRGNIPGLQNNSPFLFGGGASSPYSAVSEDVFNAFQPFYSNGTLYNPLNPGNNAPDYIKYNAGLNQEVLNFLPANMRNLNFNENLNNPETILGFFNALNAARTQNRLPGITDVFSGYQQGQQLPNSAFATNPLGFYSPSQAAPDGFKYTLYDPDGEGSRVPIYGLTPGAQPTTLQQATGMLDILNNPDIGYNFFGLNSNIFNRNPQGQFSVNSSFFNPTPSGSGTPVNNSPPPQNQYNELATFISGLNFGGGSGNNNNFPTNTQTGGGTNNNTVSSNTPGPLNWFGNQQQNRNPSGNNFVF